MPSLIPNTTSFMVILLPIGILRSRAAFILILVKVSLQVPFSLMAFTFSSFARSSLNFILEKRLTPCSIFISPSSFNADKLMVASSSARVDIIRAVPDNSMASIGASAVANCENLNPAGGATAKSMVDLSSAVAPLNCSSASPKLV